MSSRPRTPRNRGVRGSSHPGGGGLGRGGNRPGGARRPVTSGSGCAIVAVPTLALVAIIGLAVIVAGIYPLAWIADVAGSLGLAGLFVAGGAMSLATGWRTAR